MAFPFILFSRYDLSSKRLRDAHKVALDREGEIKRRIPFVERTIIHYEPGKRDYQRFAVPLTDKDSVISEHFARAPFIALWDKKVSDGTVSDPVVLDNRFTGLEKGKGMGLAEFLVERGIISLFKGGF
jgi:hypothetical protein